MSLSELEQHLPVDIALERISDWILVRMAKAYGWKPEDPGAINSHTTLPESTRKSASCTAFETV